MPGLSVYRSSRLEALADKLGEIVRGPLPDPLQEETIVVQSLGMRRWLSLSLANRLGIAMNCRFPFPDTLAHEVFRAAFPELPAESAFRREVLPWRIFAILPRLLSLPEFGQLKHYIGDGELSALKQFQLSRQLAALYDRHLAYRPEMLLEWQRGGAGEWQARLWRELAVGYEKTHPPGLLERLGQRIKRGDNELPGIPGRLSLFGVSALPPYYIHLLEAVAQCVDLHLFLFEPTDQYWGEIQSPREQRSFLRRHAREGQTAADFHLETGNALLASMGKPSRLFARAVQELDPQVNEDLFVKPPTADAKAKDGSSLLAQVQADIFELEERAKNEPGRIAAKDRSIQVHCCHGPMRELEVLHDQLLDLFQRVPGLTPKDIVVMMPDVETFAPFIEAVFGAPDDEAHRIPFAIADRSATAENAIAQTFLQLLALHGSRFSAAEVFALLETDAVRRRFDLDEGDLEMIREWIGEAAIRWGIDARHRTEFDLPAFAQNSWRTGLDRLLLGYALEPEGSQLFEEIAPLGNIEGGLGAVAGQLADFAEKLFEFIPKLSQPRTFEAWARLLGQLLHTFMAEAPESVNEIRAVRAVFDGLTKLQAIQTEAVPFEVVHAHLTQAFADTESGRGFLVGHVTFCSLKPMRSIPFRVICILGLNDTAFPRHDPAGELDRLARSGDVGRSRRDEDRQVFLEAILSARDVLLLSYSGFSMADNSEAPPSVVVSEVLDYLDANYVMEGVDDVKLRDWVVTKHKLQPFSAAYFAEDERLFSYSSENCRASLEMRKARDGSAGLVGEPLPESEAEWRRVSLEDLQRFFREPSKYFLTKRLGVRLPDQANLIEESEPMMVDSLGRWNLQNKMMQSLLAGADREAEDRAWRASGLLPPGYEGEVLLDAAHGTLGRLVERVRAELREEPLAPIPFVLSLGEWELSGALNRVHSSGIVGTVGWAIKGKDRLLAWIEHLVWNALPPEKGRNLETRVFATDATIRFGPTAEAAQILEDLLSLYGEGLREPLRFFPESSYEFARRTLYPRKGERADPTAQGRLKWKDEGGKPYNELCFRDREPLDDRWREIALRVFRPLLEQMKEEKA